MANYRRKPRPIYSNQPAMNHALNMNIRQSEVRVLDAENQMLGVMSLSEALEMAFAEGKDLIEINGKASPALCKIQEYSKFKYQLSKAESAKVDTTPKEKTLRLSVRIGPHDLMNNAKKADDFVVKKNIVKIQIKMRGREKSHPELTYEIMDQFLGMLSQPIDFVSEPKLNGDSNICVFKLSKGKSVVKEEGRDEPEQGIKS
jgi:translation initiation factor IF-3